MPALNHNPRRDSQMTRGRNWFVWRVVATVVLLGLLAAGGFAVHRLGWSQGYAAAELADRGEEVPTPPLAPPGWRPVGFARGGLLLTSLLLGFLFLVFVGKLVRLIMWGAMAGPAMAWHGTGGPWHHHWHCRHGPVPPWHGPNYGWPNESSQADGAEEKAAA
jgi:hypothetical protein